MWKKFAVPNFGSVMAWVSGIGKQWWFTPLIVVVMFTVFVLWVLSSQTKPQETPVLVDNTTVAPPTAVQPVVATAVPPTATTVQPTAVPPTATTVQPTAVPPTATTVPPTAASNPTTCIGKFEGPDAFEQAKQKCSGVNFRVLWTSPRDWDGCVFNSDNVPSDFGSEDVLQGQKLVIWVLRPDETLTDKPDCHHRVGRPSSGGSVPVNSTTECRGMFEGNDALNIAKSTCRDKEFRVKWTNPRDPLGCMFNSNQVPKDFNSPEVMQGQKLVFWIPLESEDLSSIPTCPNLR